MHTELSKYDKIMMALVKIQEQEISLSIDQRLKVQYNINNIYRVIWGQCTDVLHLVAKRE